MRRFLFLFMIDCAALALAAEPGLVVKESTIGVKQAAAGRGMGFRLAATL